MFIRKKSGNLQPNINIENCLEMNSIISLKKIVFSLALLSLLVGCKKGGDKNTSSATGWKINAKEGGFQYNTKFKEQETAPGLVFVEGGTFTMGKTQDDPMHDWNNTPSQQHIQSFYMDETEVTNKMYMEYLDWLKHVFPPEEEQYRNIYLGALPDTLVWRNELGFNETMVTNYLRHPAYAEYPVVGVNWLQAVQFANWRTNRVNEAVLEREGHLEKGSRYKATAQGTFSTETYLNAPNKSYGGQIQEMAGKKSKTKEGDIAYAKQTEGILLPEYRLPTEAEWEYAAKALNGLREYNSVRGRKKYPWESGYTRSDRRKNFGDQLANFKQGRGDYGGLAGWSDDGGDITVAVKSYAPNDFGLYDMAGNVAEWVADLYRPIVDDEINDFNYYRGNVYMKNKIGEDGTVDVVSPENILYDTLSNGKIVARNLPGYVVTLPVDENETYLRYNFTRSDNRNYRDGDLPSTKAYLNGEVKAEGDAGVVEEKNPGKDPNISRMMYESPNQIISKAEDGKMKKTYDTANLGIRTTLVDDQARVFKGGSWRDRAYWLDPAQRRFLPEYSATDYIGFRCAMSRVGSKAKKKKSSRG